MAIKVERVNVTAKRGFIPAGAYNPITGTSMSTPRGCGDEVRDGDQVMVIERDYMRSATIFLRSFDGGRTWTAFQAYDILQTRI